MGHIATAEFAPNNVPPPEVIAQRAGDSLVRHSSRCSPDYMVPPTSPMRGIRGRLARVLLGYVCFFVGPSSEEAPPSRPLERDKMPEEHTTESPTHLAAPGTKLHVNNEQPVRKGEAARFASDMLRSAPEAIRILNNLSAKRDRRGTETS